MRVYYINVQQKADESDKARSTIGGRPIFAKGQQWPHCKLCKQQMVLFFQFDLPRGYDLPFKQDSHLLVFMCPVHNDVPLDVSEYADKNLPSEYWLKDFGHYELIFNSPTRNEVIGPRETKLVARRIRFKDSDEDIVWDGKYEKGSDGFKVGGVPALPEAGDFHLCACGAEMVFLCQIPERFSFSASPAAEKQPDETPLTLFAGRPSYIYACKDQCTPHSLYAVSLDFEDSERDIA